MCTVDNATYSKAEEGKFGLCLFDLTRGSQCYSRHVNFYPVYAAPRWFTASLGVATIA